jgi:hypothetical protein
MGPSSALPDYFQTPTPVFHKLERYQLDKGPPGANGLYEASPAAYKDVASGEAPVTGVNLISLPPSQLPFLLRLTPSPVGALEIARSIWDKPQFLLSRARGRVTGPFLAICP